MADPSHFHDRLPAYLPDPTNFYRGLSVPDRVRVDNVLIFQRTTRTTLRQNLLQNRMHHRYVLAYVVEEPGRVFLDGAAVRLNEGEALLIVPYQYHDYYEMRRERLRWLFITFEVLQGGGFLADLRNRALRPDAAARNLWLEIVELWQNRKPEQDRSSEILPTLERLLMHLKTIGDLGMPEPPESRGYSGQIDDEWVHRVEELILRSVYEDWSLEEVARRMNVSLRYLRSRFEKSMGLAPSEYRANYQLHAAMLLMRDSRLSLSQVAERSGFKSLPVFSRFVKRRSGLTPRSLRERLMKGEFEFSFSGRTSVAKTTSSVIKGC